MTHLHAPWQSALLDVTVELIEITTDTTEDGIAYAACFAVWDAVEVEGTQRPFWKDGDIVFPDRDGG